jgi:hypothetical protein
LCLLLLLQVKGLTLLLMLFLGYNNLLQACYLLVEQRVLDGDIVERAANLLQLLAALIASYLSQQSLNLEPIFARVD